SSFLRRKPLPPMKRVCPLTSSAPALAPSNSIASSCQVPCHCRISRRIASSRVLGCEPGTVESLKKPPSTSSSPIDMFSPYRKAPSRQPSRAAATPHFGDTFTLPRALCSHKSDRQADTAPRGRSASKASSVGAAGSRQPGLQPAAQRAADQQSLVPAGQLGAGLPHVVCERLDLPQGRQAALEEQVDVGQDFHGDRCDRRQRRS